MPSFNKTKHPKRGHKVQDGETQVQAKKKTTKKLDCKGNKNKSKTQIPLVTSSISNNEKGGTSERTLSLEVQCKKDLKSIRKKISG